MRAAPSPAPNEPVMVRATYLGERLRARTSTRSRRLMTTPVTRPVGQGGRAVLFPYGVVVTIDTSLAEDATFFAELAEQVDGAFPEPTSDELEVCVADDGRERMDEAGVLWLRDRTEAHLAMVADVLSKNVVLEHFEETFERFYEQIDPLAERIEQTGRPPGKTRELVKLIGRALRIRQETVWRVEVEEKPDLTWEDPDLDALHVRLAAEYELAERHAALDRKLSLLNETAETLLELVQTNRSLRVEWYIVGLILIEIVLTLIEMTFG